jgi:predicted protein tyrosine phosphatase
MVEVRITTAEEAIRLLEGGWPTTAVSLVGDDLPFALPIYGPHHLVVNVDDLEDEVIGYVAPTEELLRTVLRHTKGLRDFDRLLVHCHAGKSRSPAMAIGILIQAGMSPAAAFEQVRTVRPELIPNRLMIRQLDKILELGGELIAIVDEHYQSLGPNALQPDRGGLNV